MICRAIRWPARAVVSLAKETLWAAQFASYIMGFHIGGPDPFPTQEEIDDLIKNAGLSLDKDPDDPYS